VLAIADLRELWLEARLPQESAARVAAGMSVSVTPPGADEIIGVVTTIGGVVDANTQTVLVRATVANGGGVLRAGQFLTARFRSRPSGGAAFAVPTAAITRNGADALLFIRSGANVEARQVAVLGDDGERVYVSGGIGPADRIAVEGISALKALWLSSSEEGG
jgi:multidrug efflux pump subunit AcrA (membrane-fusion protein)